MRPALSFLICGLLAVAGCKTIEPEQVASNLMVVTPEGAGPFPVVIMYQGTGADSSRGWTWSRWLRGKGVASVIIDNAAIRGRAKTRPARCTLRMAQWRGIS